MRNWKQRLTNHGIDLGKAEGLTNIRFADDFFFAKSHSELTYMLGTLIEELRAVGLLNPRKAKTSTTALTSPRFFGCGRQLR